MGVTGIGLGGMQAAQDLLEKSANRIAKEAVPEPSDAADVLQAREQFQTNARVVSVGDGMQKSLLDLLA
jgi:hypothetical protein